MSKAFLQLNGLRPRIILINTTTTQLLQYPFGLFVLLVFHIFFMFHRFLFLAFLFVLFAALVSHCVPPLVLSVMFLPFGNMCSSR